MTKREAWKRVVRLASTKGFAPWLLTVTFPIRISSKRMRGLIAGRLRRILSDYGVSGYGGPELHTGGGLQHGNVHYHYVILAPTGTPMKFIAKEYGVELGLDVNSVDVDFLIDAERAIDYAVDYCPSATWFGVEHTWDSRYMVEALRWKEVQHFFVNKSRGWFARVSWKQADIWSVKQCRLT